MKKIYRYSNFYQVRTANYSKSEYITAADKDNFRINDGNLEKIIKSSSPSLAKFLESDNKDLNSEKLKRTLNKYLNRISTRATPYSLFASQRFVVGDSNYCFENLNISNLTFYVSRSSQNLENAIELQRENNLKYLRGGIKLNPLVNDYKNTINYTYAVDRSKNNWDMQEVSKTRLLNILVSYIKDNQNNVSLKEVFKLIRNNVPDSFEEFYIYEYLKKLYDIGLIIIDPQYPVETEVGSFHEGLDVVRRKKINYQQVEELLQSGFFESGRELFDSQLQKNQVSTLDKNEIDQIIDAANIILSFSLNQTPRLKQLVSWKQKFIEKWGINILVPVNVAVDEFQGIGPLNDYLNPPRETELDVNFDVGVSNQSLINSMYISGIRDNGLIVNVEDFVVPSPSEEGFPLLDVTVTKHKDPQDEEKSKFVFRSDAFNIGGHLTSRFMYMVDDEEKKIWREYFRNPSLQNINNELCVVTTVSGFNVVDGLSVNTPPTDTMITVGTDKFGATDTLPLDDLYVSVDSDNRVYIYSKSLKKEISFITASMINQTMLPNVVRLLLDITMSNFKYLNGFTWGKLESLPILPAVRYRNHILRPAEWKVTKEISGIAREIRKNLYSPQKLKNHLQALGVPRYFYLSSDDNRLLIDIESNLLLDILVKEISNNEGYIIESSYFDNLSSDYDSDGKGYFSEYVLSLEKVSDIEYPKVKFDKKYKDFSVSRIDDNWFTFNIYIPTGKTNVYLNLLFSRYKEYFENGDIYYVRYADPQRHLRLRINRKVSIEEIVNDLSLDVDSQIISSWSMQNLIPEYERYGGVGNWEKITSLFAESSKYILDNMSYKKSDEFSGYFPIVSCMHILNELKIKDEDIVKLIPKIIPTDEFRKKYREHEASLEEDLMEEGYPLPAHRLVGESIKSNVIISMDILHMHINRLESSGDAFERNVLWACRNQAMKKLRMKNG